MERIACVMFLYWGAFQLSDYPFKPRQMWDAPTRTRFCSTFSAWMTRN